MISSLTEQTMNLLKKLQSDPVLEKAATTTGISTGTGVVNYNLEPYAKTLYPVITPIRNKVPRFTDANGGNAVHWKVITSINPGRTFPGTAEGIRGAVIDQSTDDRLASFVRFSLENSITEEAIMQAQGFDNALAIQADNLLRSMFIMEEEWMLAGNGPSGLAKPAPAPAGVLADGGSMSVGDVYCFVAALTYDGYKRATLAGGVVTSFQKSSPAAESMTINGGVSKISDVSAKVTTIAAKKTVNWSVKAVPGAFGYAWFIGADNNPANASLAGITTNNTFTQAADAAGTQKAGAIGATDYSRNTCAFDGLILQALTGNGQYLSLDGAKLTGNADGSINEIDQVLQNFYDAYKVSPTKMWVSTQQARDITTKVLAANSSGVFHINIANGGAQGGVTGGSLVSAYLNKFAVGGPKELPIEVHPNLPAGKIFFDCDEIPYPLANIPGPYRMHLLRDYYQRLWPQTTETRFTSVNFYGVLQVYTPFAMGLLDNVGNG